MADIAPELYEKIKERFDRKYAQAQLFGNSLASVFDEIKAGTATFQTADLYAVEVGSMMAESMKEVLKLDELPNGQLYRNIADKTIGEGLKDTYGLVSNIAATIQEEINETAGIGIEAIRPKLETDRIDKIVDRAVSAKTQTALENNLDVTVPTFARQVVDDSQKANARLHNKAGLDVKVEREYDGVGLHDGKDVCDFCVQRVGTWTYDKALANGVFERHEGCGCIIEYTSRKGEKTRGRGFVETNGKTGTGWVWEETHQERIENPGVMEKQIIERRAQRENKIFTDKEGNVIIATGKQFGKKCGEHAKDFGLDASSDEGRREFERITRDIIQNYDEKKHGSWRMQEGDCSFYLKGEDVVIANKDYYVTTLKGGIENARIKNARRQKI